MKIKYANGISEGFINLSNQLEQLFDDLAGGRHDWEEYAARNALDGIHDTFVAYEHDIPAGYASFKKYAFRIADVKRVFVYLIIAADRLLNR